MKNVSRRTAIKLSAQGFFTLSATLPFLGCLSTNKNEKNATKQSWQDFIEGIQRLAESKIKLKWNQEEYSKEVLSTLKSLDLKDLNIKTFEDRYKNARKNFPEINTMHKEQNFMVSLLEFEPGEKIKLHNHPDMSGVILCKEGRINIQNYDLQKNKSSNNKLLLKQTANITMTPGDTCFLTVNSGNIHALQADEFTRLIDVFTPPYNKDRVTRSKWYKKTSTYYNGTAGLFEAVEA